MSAIGWNILPACFRCNYIKSRNFAIILNGKTKQVEVIVKYALNGIHRHDGKSYARKGKCVKCYKCPDEEFTIRENAKGKPGPMGCFFVEIRPPKDRKVGGDLYV